MSESASLPHSPRTGCDTPDHKTTQTLYSAETTACTTVGSNKCTRSLKNNPLPDAIFQTTATTGQWPLPGRRNRMVPLRSSIDGCSCVCEHCVLIRKPVPGIRRYRASPCSSLVVDVAFGQSLLSACEMPDYQWQILPLLVSLRNVRPQSACFEDLG